MKMIFFKQEYVLRRFQESKVVKGYISTTYEEKTVPMDIQTTENVDITESDGTRSVQKLKAFCDMEIRVADVKKQHTADWVWFQGKWFECQSCRLSENTFLKHYLATFIECLDQKEGPEEKNESDRSERPTV